MSTSKIPSKPPYDALRDLLDQVQKAWSTRIAIISLPLLIAAFAVQASWTQGWTAALSIGALVLFMCLGLGACLVYASRGLGYGVTNEKLIREGVAFLRGEAYADHILNTIAQRAEVSSGAGPMRSLIPILLIPIIVSGLAGIGQVSLPIQVWAIIGLVTVGLSLALAEEVYRTHIDAVIRHALAEYRCECAEQRISRKDNQLLDSFLATEVAPGDLAKHEQQGKVSRPALPQNVAAQSPRRIPRSPASRRTRPRRRR